ncbi:MAG: DMT family transporter [Bacteroidales bacterium]|jgi:drug/metabolite transporter (DMT)-like permease|nr:DMT family transporter [Bacteroidales bacterium]
MTTKTKYSFLLLLQCTIFGFSFIIVKLILVQGISPFLFLAIRFLIGAFALFLFSQLLNIFRNKKGEISKISKKELKYGFIAGLLLFIAFVLQTFGASYTTPAKNGVFTGLFVIFVPIVFMFLKKKFEWKTLLLAIISFVGVMIVSDFFAEQFIINTGDILTIICALVFAIHFIVLEKILVNKDVDFLNFTTVQLLVVSIFSFIASYFFEKDIINVNILKSIWWIIFEGIIATALTYYIQTLVQSKLSANTVSILSCSESVFSVIFALILGYDNFSLTLLFGTIIIIISMVLTSIRKDVKYFEKGK